MNEDDPLLNMSRHNRGVDWTSCVRLRKPPTLGMRTRVVFFWATMVRGEQLLQQRGRGRCKGRVDACKRLYIQHASTDAHTTAAIHHAVKNETKTLRGLWLQFHLMCDCLVNLIWYLSLSRYDQCTLWHGEYSYREVMSRHSMTVKQPERESISRI